MSISTKVEMKGPIFERGIPQLDRATHAMVDKLVQMGEQRLDLVLRPRPKPGVFLTTLQAGGIKRASQGAYRSGVVGTVTGLTGVITDGGVVYGPWLEGTSSRNKTTSFKGYHSFKKTRDWLRVQSKAMSGKFAEQITRRLGR